MLEFLLCSLVTIFPDYLFRRFGQGKRLGREITLYSVWYELRWGIVACVLLTLSLITLIFYFHPSTTAASTLFRTVPVLPEASGRVAEIYVGGRQTVAAGEPLFRLDSATQEAAIETARRRSAEIDAELIAARTELAAAEGRIREAEGAYRQALEEFEMRAELQARNASAIAARDVERAQINVDARQGALDAALANRDSVSARLATQLPAAKASAEAALAEAQVQLDKTVIRAGVDGTLEQFALRPGDIVNPFMRPAGVLVPADAGRRRIVAGFGQIEAQVMRVGMIGEVTCVSQPFAIIPVVVTEIQDAIAAGQVRPTDVLVDAAQLARPGTLTVFLEPLFEGQFDGLPPGSSCIANAYTSNHDRLDDPALGVFGRVALHTIDAVALVHAMILRLQALLLPVQTLVLGGH